MPVMSLKVRSFEGGVGAVIRVRAREGRILHTFLSAADLEELAEQVGPALVEAQRRARLVEDRAELGT